MSHGQRTDQENSHARADCERSQPIPAKRRGLTFGRYLLRSGLEQPAPSPRWSRLPTTVALLQQLNHGDCICQRLLIGRSGLAELSPHQTMARMSLAGHMRLNCWLNAVKGQHDFKVHPQQTGRVSIYTLLTVWSISRTLRQNSD